MQLCDDDRLRVVYPFQFLATLGYGLSQGALHASFSVINRGPDPMPFGFGWHPYFQVPLSPASRRADCFIELPDAKRVTPQGKWDRYIAKPFLSQNWSVDEDVSGTLFLTDFKKNEIVLVDPKSGREVVMTLGGDPKHRFLALWASSTEVPFYCVEPWTSLPNAFGRKQDRDLITIASGETFETELGL